MYHILLETSSKYCILGSIVAHGCPAIVAGTWVHSGAGCNALVFGAQIQSYADCCVLGNVFGCCFCLEISEVTVCGLSLSTRFCVDWFIVEVAGCVICFVTLFVVFGGVTTGAVTCFASGLTTGATIGLPYGSRLPDIDDALFVIDLKEVNLCYC